MRTILLFKGFILSKAEQLGLFAVPVQVAGSVDKHGTVRKPHVRIQKVRAKEAPAAARKPAAEESPKMGARLRAWLDKHGGLGAVAKIVAEAPESARTKMLELMAGVGRAPVEQVRAMLEGAKPGAAQADLFSAPAAAVPASGDLFSQAAAKVEPKRAEAGGFVTPPKLDKPVIEHEGESWYVINTGAAREDGKVFAHLSSVTRGRPAKNGIHPLQIADWVDRAKLGMAPPDEALPIVEHTTKKGKTVRGVVRADLTKEEAQAIDPYTFRKDGGWFIREKHLGGNEDGPKEGERNADGLVFRDGRWHRDDATDAGKEPLPVPEAAFADLLNGAAQGDGEGIQYFTPPEQTVRAEDRAKAAGEISPEHARARIEEWKAHAKAQGESRINADKVVLSLFDASGEWSQPWVDAGYEVHRFDIQDGADINDFSVEHLIERLGIERADVILAAPPCTDFSSSGAHAWAKKDADGRTKASIELVRQTLRTVELFKPAVWVLENPVGRIQRLTSLPKPTLTFQPHNFGDPYTKRTLLWGDFQAELPLANVNPSDGSKITRKLSGSDKYGRSLTPEGFAYAFFMANNLADMGAAGALAQEFKGFPREELKAAVDAGMTEREIRSAIEDSYYDHDLDGARQALRDAMPRTPEPPDSTVPQAHDVSAPFGVPAGTTKAERRRLNAEAVELVRRGGPYSEAEKAALRQYSGTGGVGDSLNEFYTLPEVATAMWSVAARLGLEAGDVLEPSCGAGVFLHTAPAGVKVTGVELDTTSSAVAKALHGDRNEIRNASLERFAQEDGRRFKAVIGNVPFGLRGSLIKDDKPHLKTAEAYFCDTALDKCEPGGLVGLIVPTGVMDGKNNRALRERLLRKGEFLGAQRMPNTAFEHSHTEVTTDVLWFRKRPDDVAGALSHASVTQKMLRELGVWDDEFLSGGYFTGRGAGNIFGSMEAGWRAKAGMGADITVVGSMRGVPEALAEFAPDVGAASPSMQAILAQFDGDEAAREKVLGAAMTRPYEAKAKVGDTKTVDGVVYVLQGRPPRWHRVDEVLQSDALTRAQAIARELDDLIEGRRGVDRAQLEKDLQAWVDEYGAPSRNKDVLLGAQQDRVLYRLIGAVKADGSLSDAVRGVAPQAVKGSFESTVTAMLLDREAVSVDDIAARAGVDAEEALDHLYASPRYAFDPQAGRWTTRDIYLSGDLWAKLDAVRARLADADTPAELRKKLEGQETAMSAAIEPASLEDVFVQMNSAFVPTEVLAAFWNWKYHDSPVANDWTKKLPPVEITFENGLYRIQGGNEYGDQKLLDKYLNRTGLRKDDKPTIDALNDEFKDWLCASSYREQLEELYNRKFRGYVSREFSNEPMDIPGLAGEGLKDYQWGGLRWALNAGKGIIAADVGLGKTARALLLARTLKLSGRAQKPLIVVPKSVLANWFAECEKWFPGSRVMTIGGSFEHQADGTLKGKDDTAAERKRKYHDIQQNDYDFIICSEPAFEEVDLDPATKNDYNARDFWVQRGDHLGNEGDKRTKKIREAWEQSRAGQEFGESSRTDATYFNELGVDALIHDEFHHQKNLYAAKSRFGDQPKFLGGQGLSMRALDFNLKARWILDQNDGKNVYGLTATPTKNSPLEIYSMLSHVAPEAFERIGVRNSEELLDRFAKFEDGMALNTRGEMEEALVTSGFRNMDELRSIMQRYIHRQTADDVGLKLPGRDDRTHFVEMDDEQQKVYAELRELAEESGGKDATGDAHIFSIMDKMNKAAMDLSLLDPDQYAGRSSPKYQACAEQVVAGLRDGGQIIFADYVDAHDKMVEALVRAGIPRGQIGVINAKVAGSAVKRQQIADAFNAGKLRVVIGNTATMGEGLNLQKGTADIHHLDLPWEPASMQQRNGRGLRQGNTNASIRIHSYLARGSFDGYRYQSMMAKKDWQDLIWSGGDELENLSRQGNVSRDEMMIMLAADPDQARAAFEANTKAKEERFAAGKRAEAAGRFVKFQSLKRSFGELKNKDTASAQRLKTKIDRERAALAADRYFPAKDALDLDNVVIEPESGRAIVAGHGLEFEEDGKPDRYVVTGTDYRTGAVTVRRYGETSGVKRTWPLEKLKGSKAYAYDDKAEAAEIGRRLEEEAKAGATKIKSLDEVMKLPPRIAAELHGQLQETLWKGAKDYTININGKVPMVEKATGKPVIAESYNVRQLSPETHDFMLPTEENRERAIQGWMEARRASSFGTDTNQARRGGRTTTVAKRKYGVLQNDNPWSRIVATMHGEEAHYGATPPSVKAARARLEKEQNERILRAKSLAEAFDHAAAIGKIAEPSQGYGARVTLPKKTLATLWAKAKRLGVLGESIEAHTPTAESKTYPKHSSYFVGRTGTARSTLLRMTVGSGHNDLVRAMVESSLPTMEPREALEALGAVSAGYGLGEGGMRSDRARAMIALAEKAGVMDVTKDALGFRDGHLSINNPWAPDRRDTVRTILERVLAHATERERAAADAIDKVA